MSVMETRLGSRRAAARNAAETRKKLLLGGLVLVLVVLLAFELPKLMKRSSSSSSTASTPTATTVAPPAAAGTAPLAGISAKSSAARARAIRHMPARNPFAPLLHESTSTSSSESTPAPALAPAPAPAAAPAPVASRPEIPFTPSAVTPAAPAPPKPAVTKPVHVKPAAPTAAVIWTNGSRQVVGLSQVFKIGSVEFRLVAVTPKTVRVRIVNGAFAGGKQAITARRNHRVTLTNTATGIEYGFLFTAGTTGPATTN